MLPGRPVRVASSRRPWNPSGILGSRRAPGELCYIALNISSSFQPSTDTVKVIGVREVSAVAVLSAFVLGVYGSGVFSSIWSRMVVLAQLHTSAATNRATKSASVVRVFMLQCVDLFPQFVALSVQFRNVIRHLISTE